MIERKVIFGADRLVKGSAHRDTVGSTALFANRFGCEWAM
jgi:hypothetical protein